MSLQTSPDQVLPKGSLILVTGASGYIAANIVREALDNGYRVRGTVRSKEKASKTKQIFKSSDYEAVVVPEMEPAGAFDEAVKDVDAVIHTASPGLFDPDPTKVVGPAVNGTLSIMESALKESSVKRFVYTSSSVVATMPNAERKVKVDKNSWVEGFDGFADYPPPYTPDKGFGVYIISKVKAEQAVWNFVENKKPHFVVNSILPDFNMGRVIGDAGLSAKIIQSAYKGDVEWTMSPQYMIDVVDDARIHLAVALDKTIVSERIFAFAAPFDWNDILDVFRELRPDNSFPENRDLPRDLTEVDSHLGADLLKKWWGQDGYTSLKDSLRQNVEGQA